MLILYALSMLICGVLGGWLARLDGLNHTLGIVVGVVFIWGGVLLLLVIRGAEVLDDGVATTAVRVRQSLKPRGAS